MTNTPLQRLADLYFRREYASMPVPEELGRYLLLCFRSSPTNESEGGFFRIILGSRASGERHSSFLGANGSFPFLEYAHLCMETYEFRSKSRVTMSPSSSY